MDTVPGTGMLGSRHGGMFLLLLMVLVVAGLVASGLIPQAVTVEQRSAETGLKTGLSQLRMAMTLERIVGNASASFHKDWTVRANLNAYLDELATRGYLAGVPSDPMVSPAQWGRPTGRVFWVPTQNCLSSSSFELVRLSDSTWATGSQNVLATVTTKYWVGQDDAAVDSFPGENRFGTPLGTGGSCLLVTHP